LPAEFTTFAVPEKNPVFSAKENLNALSFSASVNFRASATR
jgi:hypothetical protein